MPPVSFAKPVLLVALGLVYVGFAIAWVLLARKRAPGDQAKPTAFHLAVGVVTDFLDTLGIGSFATTTTAYGLAKRVDARLVPGTLNVGHAIPTFVQALIYVTIVEVDMTTLFVMIAAAVGGAWLGADVVAGLSRRAVRIGMGSALLVASAIMTASTLGLLPKGGAQIGLSGTMLAAGAAANFALGALMTVGVGLYAPCMILVSLLGMNARAAFPIMMGSCAFLMPLSGIEFIRRGAYDLRASLGLTLGGAPAVLAAAFLVTHASLDAVRWLVVVVASYTAVTMLVAARRDEKTPDHMAGSDSIG
jgi:uncharacterized membrane protein YfcA